MLAERKHRILRTLAQRPRRAIHFTGGQLGDLSIAPHVLMRYLDEPCNLGLIELHNIDYHLTEAGRAHLSDLDAGKAAAEQRVFCNAAMREHYQPKAWHVREGGEAHKQFRSKGLG